MQGITRIVANSPPLQKVGVRKDDIMEKVGETWVKKKGKIEEKLQKFPSSFPKSGCQSVFRYQKAKLYIKYVLNNDLAPYPSPAPVAQW